MAYPRSINAEWKVGMTVEYQHAHHRTTDPVVLTTIKRISPKLGVAVCDITRHDGIVEERKFQLGWLDYANETSKGYSRFKASIVIPSAARTKQREDAIRAEDIKQRQHTALKYLSEHAHYYLLNDFMLDRLESMVTALEAAKKVNKE